ncbi:MAG: DUF99 family protein [Candidatus Nanohaloarchaea archaeon]
MKSGARILGIDDGPRELEKIIGVVYRGTEFIEQVELLDQKTDKGESTEKILELYTEFNQYVEALVLDGVSFNGFNVADIEKISEETGRPVIAVTSNTPDKQRMKKGLKSADLDTGIIERLPEIHELEDVYIQFAGCGLEDAAEIIEKSTVQGSIPEAVRTAHLIGEGLSQT